MPRLHPAGALRRQIIALLERALQDADRGLGRSRAHQHDPRPSPPSPASRAATPATRSTPSISPPHSPKAAAPPRSPRSSPPKPCSAASLLYDKKGEQHYDLISALHKSVRNSDADAALYWLGRMLAAGEDPMYVARRVVRMAVEDIGLAAPEALNLCLSARDAMHFLGSPEGESRPRAGRRLSRPRAQVQRRLHRLLRGRSRHRSHRRRTRPAPPAQRPDTPHERARLRQGLPLRARPARQGRRHALPAAKPLADRRYYHPTDQGREKQLAQHHEEVTLAARCNTKHRPREDLNAN